MDLRKIYLIVALSLSGLVNADVVTVVNAVETVTSNISVPTSPNGRLMFRPCDTACDAKFIAVRLTPETRYSVNGQAMSFTDFRREFFNRRRGGDDYALVSYDTETSTATSVFIDF